MSLTISEVQPGAESFQGLVLRFRGRTALTQGQLAARAHASLRSIQAWEAGISYPGTENLQALISCFLEAGGFARGREAAEAKAFWSAAVCESPRNRPPFDSDWFADLLARQTAAEERHARAVLIPPSAGLTNNRALRLIDWRDARPASSPSGEPEESFSGLVLGFRGRTTLTQPQLASEVGASLRSVQGWEAGITVPGLESLQALVACFLNAGAFAEGREAAQAEALWSAALRDSPRHRPPFDAAWFSDLLAMRLAAREPTVGSSTDVIVATPSTAGSRAVRLLEWGDSPDVIGFLGRSEELQLLTRRALEERCRFVAVLGAGGIGKTILTARLARDVADVFERVYWRSVRNAPALFDWLGSAIAFLSDHRVLPADSEAGRLEQLLAVLRERRCLLVLDNLEPLLQAGERVGIYREGYAGYGTLLSLIAETEHQSCLMITSREAPPELSQLRGSPAVHVLELGGLTVTDARALLRAKEMRGDEGDWASLVGRYGGNGLALKIVGESISQVFGGDIGEFMTGAGTGFAFGGIRRLLDAQVERLSTVEQDVLRWLAVEREPATFADIVRDLGPGVGRGATLEAIESLRRRSLLERDESGAAFTLQSVVLEYATDRLIEGLAQEIEEGTGTLLVDHALIKAQAKDFVRRSQERLLVQPLVDRLIATHGSRCAAEQRLISLLEQTRARPAEEHGYGPGNLVNLLRLLRGDLRALDLSGLTIRQAFLQDVEAQGASLAGSHLIDSVLSAAFNYPSCVALSADGEYLGAGTLTGEICLWRVADRTLLAIIPAHTGPVLGLALSDDGRLIASGGYDGKVRLWEAATGQLLVDLPEQTGASLCVALSHDGQLVTSANFDGTVRVWEVQSERLVGAMEGHAGRVRWVASGAAGVVATAGEDGAARLWDARSARQLTIVREEDTKLCGVSLSGDGRLMVSGGEDGKVRSWDAVTGLRLQTLAGHTGRLWSVALSHDGQLVASGGEDGTVRLWDPSSGQTLATLQGHTSTVYEVAISGDGQLVASASFDGMIRVWETRTSQVLATLQGHTSGVWGVALSADGSVVASGGEDGTARAWETISGRQLTPLEGHTSGVWGVALSRDGQLMASGNYDGSVYLWATNTGRRLAALEGHTSGICGVALSDDGALAASGSVDSSARVWDAASGRLVAVLHGHTGMVYDVAFSENGALLASASFDATVRLWDVPSGQLAAILKGHAGGVCGVAVRRDLVASGSLDGTVRLWKANGGPAVAILEGHTGAVWDVALSDDGQLLVSGSLDGTVRLWDTGSGCLLGILRGHVGGVWGVALSHDKQLLASTGVDGTVRVWATDSGANLRTLRGDRRYERLDITGLGGITEAQRRALATLGAIERVSGDPSIEPTTLRC